MNDAELRVAIAGCGRITHDHHLPAIAMVPGLTVVALADIDPDRLTTVADRFGVRGRHATVEGMLAKEQCIDLVCVAVPPRAHAEVALEAIRRGLPVLVEKPLAPDVAEAEHLVEAAAAAGVSGYCGFNLRCHRLVEEAVRTIDSGALGSLRAVRSVLTSSLRLDGAFPRWRETLETGGGALSELAIHHLDLWAHVTGQPVIRVAAAFGNEPVAEESVSVSAELQGGTVVSALFCQGTTPIHELEIFGDLGCLRLDIYRTDGLEVVPWDQGPGGLGARFRNAAESLATMWSYRGQIRNGGLYRESFARHWTAIGASLRHGVPPPSTLDDGLRAQRALAASRRSAVANTWEMTT